MPRRVVPPRATLHRAYLIASHTCRAHRCCPARSVSFAGTTQCTGLRSPFAPPAYLLASGRMTSSTKERESGWTRCVPSRHRASCRMPCALCLVLRAQGCGSTVMRAQASPQTPPPPPPPPPPNTTTTTKHHHHHHHHHRSRRSRRSCRCRRHHRRCQRRAHSREQQHHWPVFTPFSLTSLPLLRPPHSRPRRNMTRASCGFTPQMASHACWR